jgi:hypothetical protein
MHALSQCLHAATTRISIQVNRAGLAGGAYRGVLTLTFSDGSTRVINILLVVARRNRHQGRRIRSHS